MGTDSLGLQLFKDFVLVPPDTSALIMPLAPTVMPYVKITAANRITFFGDAGKVVGYIRMRRIP